MISLSGMDGEIDTLHR